MIVDLKPYNDYRKIDDMPWVSIIPSHWLLRRMKFLFHERVQKGFPEEPLLAATQTKGVVRKETYGLRTVTASKDLHLLKLVKPGDYVISLRSFQGGIEIAYDQGIISPAYTVLEPMAEATSGYYKHFFKSYGFIRALTLFVTGIREGQNIDYERLSRAYVPLPPPGEQAAIVRFLNHANYRIEKAIRAKRKVIALLNEQKQVIIHRAVTRGLDPNVKLKPSGVPWLGDIPEHWESRRVKQVSRILRGKFSHRPRNDQSLYDGQYPFIQTGAVARANKYIVGYDQTLNEKGLAVSKLFPSGTLVMAIAANIGDVAILTFDACFPDSVIGFTPCRDIHKNYLYLVFQCMKHELKMEAPVNTQGNLNVERVGGMRLPLPPMDEQLAIIHHVDEQAKPLMMALSHAERGIDLLREYRTCLIGDVVTGKLDVRATAAALPDEVEGLEVIDEVNDDSGELDAGGMEDDV